MARTASGPVRRSWTGSSDERCGRLVKLTWHGVCPQRTSPSPAFDASLSLRLQTQCLQRFIPCSCLKMMGWMFHNSGEGPAQTPVCLKELLISRCFQLLLAWKQVNVPAPKFASLDVHENEISCSDLKTSPGFSAAPPADPRTAPQAFRWTLRRFIVSEIELFSGLAD